jgi:hypothetical protein
MTREEPSLETLWLRSIGTMDKVQKIDRSNATPSSKTFRDEWFVSFYDLFVCHIPRYLPVGIQNTIALVYRITHS